MTVPQTTVSADGCESVAANAERPAERPAVYFAACLALTLLSAIPVLIALYPPFIDYPWHLARIAILATWGDSPFMQEAYEISSLILPNLALEIVMLPLAQVLPVEVAGVVFVMLTFLLILTGTAVLHKEFFGSYSWWPLVAAALLYNWIVLFGFLNYVFGVGVLLWGFALWVRMSASASRWRLACGTLFALALFFCHLVAFGLYAVAVAGHELQKAIDAWRRERRLAIRDLLIGAAQFAPAMLLYANLSPTGQITSSGFFYNIFEKLASPIVTLTSGSAMIDALSAVMLVMAAALVALFGHVAVARRSGLTLIALFAAFLALPAGTLDGGTANIDTRTPMALLFFLIAATRVTFRIHAVTTSASILFACYLVAKIVLLGIDAAEHRRLVDEYLAAYDRMASNSTLFVVRNEVQYSWRRKMYQDRIHAPTHIAALAAVRRGVFVPSVYATPGSQPLTVRPRYLPYKNFQMNDPIGVRDSVHMNTLVGEIFALRRQSSDAGPVYLLIQDRGGDRLALPSSAKLVAEGTGFRLVQLVGGAERSLQGRSPSSRARRVAAAASPRAHPPPEPAARWRSGRS